MREYGKSMDEIGEEMVVVGEEHGRNRGGTR